MKNKKIIIMMLCLIFILVSCGEKKDIDLKVFEIKELNFGDKIANPTITRLRTQIAESEFFTLE